MKNTKTTSRSINTNTNTNSVSNSASRSLLAAARLAVLVFAAALALAAGLAGAFARNVYAGGIPSRFPEAENEEGMLAYLIDKYPPTRSQHLYKDDKYGTCWAHAAVTLAEFYMISHGLSDANGPVDRNVDYSELQLLNFCYRQGPDPYQGSTGDTISKKQSESESKSEKVRMYKNLGGKYALAGQSLMRGNGFVVDAGEASYANMDKVEQDGRPLEYARSLNVASLKCYYSLDIKENPELVKAKIMENGAVGIRYYSDVKSFSEEAPKYCNVETSAVYTYLTENEGKKGINHAVVVVGWDDAYPAGNFNVRPPKDGAWLARNSHSSETGISKDSYFWLSYCDEALEADSYVFEMADYSKGEVFENLYCYDSQLHFVKKAKTAAAANVFTTVGEYETLGAVQIDATLSPAGKTTVRIYKNLADAADPQSGTLMTDAVTTEYFPYKGSYTVMLKKPVNLRKGETFAIVVQTEKPIDREMDKDLWKNSLTMDTTLHPGESFCFSKGVWVDLFQETEGGKYGNLCIRALTNCVGAFADDGGVKSIASSGAKSAKETGIKKVYVLTKNGVCRFLTNKSKTRALAKKGWSYRAAFQAVGENGVQVYWIYNKKTGGYRYTADRALAIKAKKEGCKAGKAFCGTASGGSKVYETEKAGIYYYTTSRTEVRKLQKKGWVYKGIGWYAP